MASKEKYSVDIKGYPIRGKSWLVQTWLIDMIYDVACLGSTGSKIISQNEGLHLIALYNDYQDNISRETSQKTKDVFLYVFGFFCVQKKFQNLSDYIDIFTREKYS